MVTNAPGAGCAIAFGFRWAGPIATVLAIGATPAGCGSSGTSGPPVGLEGVHRGWLHVSEQGAGRTSRPS